MGENLPGQQDSDGNKTAQPKSSGKSGRKKYRRLIVWLSAIVFVLLVAVPLLVNFYADRIFGETVREIIRVETKGKYDFQYNDIHFNLFRRDLVIEDLVIYPDSSYLRIDSAGDRPVTRYFELEIPRMQLKGAGIVKLLLRNKLEINTIFIGKPTFILVIDDISADTPAVADTAAAEKFDYRRLHTFVADYLSLLQIDNFELDQGNFEIHRMQTGQDQSFEIRNFSVILTDFYLDSLAHRQRERLFFSDSLGFSLRDGYLHFKSDLHEIALKDIELSSTDGTVVIEDMEISSDTTQLNREKEGWLDLKIPLLKLTGLDFDKTLSQQFDLQELLIKNPEIVYHPPAGRKNAEFNRKEVARRVFEEISAYFEPVAIEKLTLEHARFRISDFDSEVLENFFLPDFTLTLHQVKIDSSSFDERSPLFFVNNISLTLNNQQFKFTRAGYDLDFDQLKLDTRNSELAIEQLRLKPGDQLHKNMLIEFAAPQILIRGRDFKQDYLDRALTLKAFNISGPEIYLEKNATGSQARSSASDIYNLYPAISDFLEWLRLDRLNIESGKLTYVNKLTGNNTRIEAFPWQMGLEDFNLDGSDAGKGRIFYSEEVFGDFQNLEWVFPDGTQKMSADRLQFNTGARSLTLSSVSLDTLIGNGNKHRLASNIESIRLTGIDYRQLYRNKQYFADRLEIIRSDINLFLPTDRADGSAQTELPEFGFGEISLKQGAVSVYHGNTAPAFASASGVELTFKNFHPSSDTNLPKVMFDRADAGLSGLKLALPDSVHVLEIENLYYDTENPDLEVKGVSVIPSREDVSDDMALFRVNIGRIDWEAFRAMDYYTTQAIIGGTLRVDEPAVKISLGRPADSNRKFLPLNSELLKAQILNSFKKVDVAAVEMTGLDLDIFENRIQRDTLVIARNGNLSVMDFYVDAGTVADTARLMFASDITLQFDEVYRPGSGSETAFQLADLHLSTGEKSLAAKHINLNRFDPVTLQTEHAQSGLFVEDFRVHGLGYHNLLSDEKLHVDSIGISQPVFLLKRQITADNADETGERINLYKSISNHLKEISINDLDIAEAKLKLVNQKEDRKETYLFKRIDFDIRNVLIDSTNRVFSNNFLYSDDLDFTIHDFDHTSPDSLYDYGAALLRFSSRDLEMVVDSGFLRPNFSDAAFAERVGVQTDRMNILVDRMEMYNFRLHELILQDRLHIDKVVIDSLVGDDYRDKSYPRPANHYPPMPATALSRLDFMFRIDTLRVKNSRFTYREYVKPALQAGKIWFTDINITGRNITNDPDKIRRDTLMQFIANANLMGKAALDLYLRFSLVDPDNIFEARGVVNQMDLTELNPLLEHIAFVKVKKGRNEMLKFNFLASDSLSRGIMDFEYEKLKIRLIDKRTLQDKGFGESIASFIANTFVVRKNNPKLLIFKREGDIYFQRDVEKSFFNYLAKSVLSGVKSTIRGGNEERKEIRTKRKMERQLKEEGKLDAYFEEKKKE